MKILFIAEFVLFGETGKSDSEAENGERDSVKFCSLSVPTQVVSLLKVHLSLSFD